MKLKSRLVKYLVAIGLVLLFAGYFAFSTFLFSPIEDDFQYDVSALIPRDVDFFVARADVEELFDGFPRLAVADQLEQHSAWQTFEQSAAWGDFERDVQLQQKLADLERQLDQVPGGMEPQEIFGGRDVALAGYFRGSDMSKADWAIYGRVNWAGKLAVSLLDYPGLLKLDQQGLTVDVGGEWVSLSGGQLERPMYVSRIRDVVIVGTSTALVEKASELARTSATDSLYLSARYQDHIHNRERNPKRDEIEFFVDLRKLLENMGQSGAWPDPSSHYFTEALLGRLFQIPSCKELIGTLEIDEGVVGDMHGEFSSELVTSRQGRMFRQRSFERDDVLRSAASMAPADTVLFVYAHVPVGDLLRQIYDSVEPAARSNMDDFFQSTGAYENTESVIAELEGALKDRLALIVRRNDYPEQPGYNPADGPPNDGSPVFAITLVTWMGGSASDVEVLDKLRTKIGQSGRELGLQGRTPGENGFFEYNSSGFLTHEFWQPLIPGTGVVTTLFDGERTLISNSVELPVHVERTYLEGGLRYPRLSERTEFSYLLHSSLQDANVLVWVDPRAGMKTFLSQAAIWAEENALSDVNWNTMRAREESSVIRSMFPGKTKGSLTPEQIAELDAEVTHKMRSERERLKLERGPQLLAQRQRTLEYLSALKGALVMLRLDPAGFDLSVRAVVPLESQQP